MANILVRTPPGLKCPREGQHRSYITDEAKGTSVSDSAFYRRLVAEGSLILCKETAGAATAAPAPSAASVVPAPAASQQTASDAPASTEKEAKANG